ncbi:MAG: hypothetical protein LBB09_02560, partial [Rickettsiales bacterium]|nr:hypothetical protein [Rickettsiales bacterium]
MKKNNLEKETFIFESYSFDKDTKTLLLRYSFGGSEEFSFVEKIEFPSEKKLTEEELLALDCVFKYLHLACGVSYYKLFIPRNIEVKTFDLGEAEAKFFNDFYLNGLGEFSYRNNARDLEKRIKFPFTKNVKNRAIGIALAPKMAVAIGGGKDSVTSVEILRRRFDVKLMSVNTASPIDGTIEASGLDFFHPKRTISKNLLELNKRIEEIGGFNGHIPISGILVFISAAASIIYDFNVIIFSNERSANTGNVEFCGRMINHQWSKSFEFEKKFIGFCQQFILKNFKYISFLRPLSELHIAKLFSQSDEKYHKIFTSCNRVFKIENPASNWCGDCDKCRFVFLILSVFFK